MKITAVLTCFNRRPLTLACLDKLQRAAQQAGVQLGLVVVDDASTDGTAAAVRARFPQALVIDGPGDLFWNRGMHIGLAQAMKTPVDHLLWLNDDTQLHPDALVRLLHDAAAVATTLGRPAVMVGTTTDEAGRISYGGAVAASGLRRFSYRKVWDAQQPVPCDVINGNCVLVPWAVASAVGNIDPAFEHAMGDTDYALRARAAGFGVYVAAGVVGQCSNNARQGTFHDRSLPKRERWRKMLGRKGLPWRSWLHFTRRHGGPLWPMYFAWPYLHLWLQRKAA